MKDDDCVDAVRILLKDTPPNGVVIATTSQEVIIKCPPVYDQVWH